MANPQEAPKSGNRMQYHCSFCGKSQREVGRLIAGPGASYICDQCVILLRDAPPDREPTSESGILLQQLSGRVQDRGVQEPLEGLIAPVSAPHERCSFCGKARADVTWLAASMGKTCICDQCVKLCLEIVDEEKLSKATYSSENATVSHAAGQKQLPEASRSLADTDYDQPLSRAFDIEDLRERATRYGITIDEDAQGAISIVATNGGHPSALQFFSFLTDATFGIWTHPAYRLSGWSVFDVLRVKGYSDAEARQLIFEGRSMRELFNLPEKEPNGKDTQG